LKHCSLFEHLVTVRPSVAAFWCTLSPNCHHALRVSQLQRVLNRDLCGYNANYSKDAVDLAAPGVKINSTLTACRQGALSGTSQATPLVTFAAALLYMRGLRTPQSIKIRLISSVDVFREESEEKRLRSGEAAES